MLQRTGKSAEATEVLNNGIEATNGHGQLMWMRAAELERAQDFDGAIEIYETLYERDSSNQIVANNLASLITTHREDAESLERAFNIARRLRGTEQPAFQDTYGWIAYRRGDYEEALTYLEPAAEALSQDPLVQFHLGMTYVALEDAEKARETLKRAIELGDGSGLPQMDRARGELEKLGGN